MSDKKQLYIAADHNGWEMKNELKRWLESEGYTVTDLGPEQFDKDDDYPDFGVKVARAVAETPEQRLGILLCGTGVGMAVVADKVPGVRAGLLHDPEMAASARRDDDINVLALGARHISLEKAKEVVKAWLETEFSGAERHRRRIEKIKQYEA
jgi:RpiB/LacA/LacB family sugar-phosphate isomerase